MTPRASRDTFASIVHFREAIELEEALRTVPVRFVATPVPVASVRHRGADGHETAPVMGEAQATA